MMNSRTDPCAHSLSRSGESSENCDVAFHWAAAKETANFVVFHCTGKYLSDVEIKVLEGSWHGKTYENMAQNYGYSPEYLNKDIGNKLWKKLSDGLGERIKKNNFREALRRAWVSHKFSQAYSQLDSKAKSPLNSRCVSPVNLGASDSSLSVDNSLVPFQIPFPEGYVAPDSPLYIKRLSIESNCFKVIEQPGALIRIKAPKLMGKTSLIHQILAYVDNHQLAKSVYLDFRSCNCALLSDVDKLLRWLCVTINRRLGLEKRPEHDWDTDILGSNDNCTAYFEEYLLPALDEPLVLALDDIDRLFSYTEVAEDVLGMLRSWHEKGKVSPLWQRLRLVIAHSTEVYIPLDINQSPFNAGLPIELSEFNKQQVSGLTKLHRLNLSSQQVNTLMQMIGGHPFLIFLALYELYRGNNTLQELLDDAPTQAGIYSGHLRRHLEILQQSPDLMDALKKVVVAEKPVELDGIQTYKLHSMGLIRQQGNFVMPRCNLYRAYFYNVLKLNE